MSNLIFPTAKTAMLSGQINLIDDDIYVVLVKDDSLLPISEPVLLRGKIVVDGIFSAENITFSEMRIGETAKAVLLYSKSINIAYIDSANYGLPVVGNGGYISVLWSDGLNKIFKL